MRRADRNRNLLPVPAAEHGCRVNGVCPEFLLDPVDRLFPFPDGMNLRYIYQDHDQQARTVPFFERVKKKSIIDLDQGLIFMLPV